MSIPIDKYFKQLQFVEKSTGTIKDYTQAVPAPKDLYPDTISLNSMIDDMIRRLVSIKNTVKVNRINLMVPAIDAVDAMDNVTVTDAATIFNPAMDDTSTDIWDVGTTRSEDATNNPKIYGEFSESALFMYLRNSAYTINVVEKVGTKEDFKIAFPDKDTAADNGTVPIPGKT
jgi:hypothetical protein